MRRPPIRRPFLLGVLLLAPPLLQACREAEAEDAPPARAELPDSACTTFGEAMFLQVDSINAALAGPVRPDTGVLPVDSAAAPAPDSGAAPADSSVPAAAEARPAKGARRPEPASPLPPWPAPPTPLDGAVLPRERIVAFYGNPLTTRLGILGRIPPARMLDSLERTAALWQRADSTTTVRPALHLITVVAQAHPGADGKYRLRMSDSTIARVARWAEERGWLLFLDIQPGHSTVEDELPRLLPWLEKPYVHLALDPEFAMGSGSKPGHRIGTMDTLEINHAVRTLARLACERQLPPKVLVVHRFTTKMLTNARHILRDPRVQVVIDMDGFGSPQLKRNTWRNVVLRDPVQYAGWKLFLNPRNDFPLMTPEEVLRLEPRPVYVQYQ